MVLRRATKNDPNITAATFEKAVDLLEEITNINARTSDGKSLLVVAVEMKRYDIIPLLLNRHADKDEALLVAAKNSNVGAFTYILDELRANIGASDPNGDTVVHCAVRNSNSGILQFLVERGGIDLTERNHGSGSNIDRRGNPMTRSTPIVDAVYYGNAEAARILLDAGVGMEIVSDARSYTLLHILGHCKSKRNVVGVAKLLLERGVDVNRKTSEKNGGESPIHTASRYGHASLVEIFLDHSADVNAKNIGGRTPLHLSSSSNYSDIVELLLRRGADVMATDTLGNSALHESMLSSFSGLPICQLLVDNGADVFATNNKGEKPRETETRAQYNLDLQAAKKALLLNIEEQQGRNPGFKRPRLEDLQVPSAEETAAAAAEEAATAAEEEDEDDASEPSSDEDD